MENQYRKPMDQYQNIAILYICTESKVYDINYREKQARDMMYSVKYRLSARIYYRHPRLRQILREITDPFTVLEQKLALSLERK